MNERKINDDIVVAGQPSPEDIAQMVARGFRSVINLRTPQESGVLADEERLAEDAGLSYTAIPVSADTLDDLAMQRFEGALSGDDRTPAIVHCQGGGRAGMMVLLHLAVSNGWSVAQTLEEGQKLGIALRPNSPYMAFFEDYINRHSAGERQT